MTKVYIFTHPEIKNLWPDLNITNNELAILTKDDGVLDTGSLISILRKELIELGVRILENTKVKEVKNDGSVIMENNDVIKPSIATVIAAGPYVPKLLRNFRTKLPKVYLYRCQLHALKFVEQLKIPSLLWDCVNNFFLLMEHRDKALVGDGTIEIVNDIQEGFITSENIKYKVISSLLLRIPKASNALLYNEWAAPCEVSCDGLPIIGKLDKTNVVVVYGLNGYGLMRGPALGEITAYIALNKSHNLASALLAPSEDRGFEVGCVLELFNPSYYIL